ncbi:MAG: hypothetical protein MUF70_08145 [Myxococcota bacterium]|nr:hypothetical protein [Myxococcota bacterium]
MEVLGEMPDRRFEAWIARVHHLEPLGDERKERGGRRGRARLDSGNLEEARGEIQCVAAVDARRVKMRFVHEKTLRKRRRDCLPSGKASRRSASCQDSRERLAEHGPKARAQGLDGEHGVARWADPRQAPSREAQGEIENAGREGTTWGSSASTPRSDDVSAVRVRDEIGAGPLQARPCQCRKASDSAASPKRMGCEGFPRTLAER